ncbi:acyl-CoA N-acyltransferase [Nemania abortiva]|nr:acyl-CoA N-acyltransferase [Nemania abortiva]
MMAAQQPKPFGDIVERTTPAIHPSQETTLSGRYVTLVGLASKHIEPLYANLAGDEHADLWDYMADGPFPDSSGLHVMMEGAIASKDVITYALIPTDQPTTPEGADNVAGVASYMHADLGNRTIEAGVLYTPKLQRTSAATEAMYLMAKHAFEDLGYRRYEWKCDALNAASRRTALRLGFAFEGIFRNHMIVKGRNRDTAWYSIVDDDWPEVESALRQWLDPSNFDESGLQRKKLEDFRKK